MQKRAHAIATVRLPRLAFHTDGVGFAVCCGCALDELEVEAIAEMAWRERKQQEGAPKIHGEKDSDDSMMEQVSDDDCSDVRLLVLGGTARGFASHAGLGLMDW